MIDIRNLSKNFGTLQVLKNIDIRFEPGKVYGIIGENGAGKTTLFRCIAGLENYDGEIRSGLHPLKNYLGFLPTDPFFFSKITGKEYIRLLCNARKKEMPNLESKNIFDLPLNQYASTYSTGMKKKLALTAILLQENHYFILDEPFNGIDIHSNIIVVDLIKKLKALGKTVLISSHIFSTLKETCDEIYPLKDGKISPTVTRENFDTLELEIKAFTIGNKIEQLELK
ncbi:MAG: ATP-binding cassette domain-containing protein [Culturomica sp.]|jgi:ABC-2 type transport system ATP-binding protein|nr:ATP-binding cassette domain-containing protein [Culturomica sp.]